MPNQNTKKIKIAKGGTFGFEEKEKTSICSSIADVVGFVKNATIKVTHDLYNSEGIIQESQFNSRLPTYVINVRKTENRSSKTSMEDSVAHVLFPSARKTYVNIREEITSFSEGNDINKIHKLCDDVFDSLEKARVRSCMIVPYKGYDERSRESNNLDAKQIIEINDPIKALYASQLGQTDLVKNSQFPQANDYIKAMERTGNKATVIATKQYMEQVVKPWYEFIKEEQKQQQTDEGNDENEGNDKNGQSDNDSNDSDDDKPESQKPKWCKDPITDSQKRYIQKLGGNADESKTKGEASKQISDLLSKIGTKKPEQTPNTKPDKITKAVISNDDDHIKNIGQGCNPVIDWDNDTVKGQKNQGEQDIDEVENKISEFLRNQVKYDQDQQITQEDIEHSIGRHGIIPLSECKNHEVKVNMFVVNQLKPLFRRLKSKQISEIDSVGTDVDVDLYIKNHIEGGTDFLMTPDEQKGFAVVIGVDESGSMGGSNIESARTLCATLYKSFEDMANVDIYVFGWTTGLGGLQIKKITKFSDVGKLDATGGTPFLESTYYCANFTEKLKHKKRLFFQITDGDILNDHALEKYFSKLRRSRIDITGIQISTTRENPQMKALFGKHNYIHTKSMESAGGVITRDIVQKFAKCIQ